jgi:uncharacterized lipoprotein YbaY
MMISGLTPTYDPPSVSATHTSQSNKQSVAERVLVRNSRPLRPPSVSAVSTLTAMSSHATMATQFQHHSAYIRMQCNEFQAVQYSEVKPRERVSLPDDASRFHGDGLYK